MATSPFSAPPLPSAQAAGPRTRPEVAASPRPAATSIPSGLPSDQSSMLHDLASLALGFAPAVGPGHVTPQQQAVLAAWQQNASSSYSQYMLDQGLRSVGQDPDALFSQEALAAQAGWSQEDLRTSLAALRISMTDYDDWSKLEASKRASEQKGLSGLFKLAGTLVGAYFGGPTGAAAGGAAGSAIGNAI